MVKLDKDCKALRKEWMAHIAEKFSGATMAMSEDGFTVLYVPAESVDYVATAVASEEDFETGVSRKVGEFYALQRFMEGQAVPVPKNENYTAYDFLKDLDFNPKSFKGNTTTQRWL